MMRVLFGESYYLRFDPKLWEAMQPYPPLGTLYAASFVRERGHDVALFDAMLADGTREWSSAVASAAPDVAVIYEDSFNYLTKMCLLRMRDAALEMAAAARSRGCVVVVAGSDATDDPELYLRGGVDYALSGEGEVTLAELLGRISAGAAVGDVPGLAFLGADGRIVRTGHRPEMRDLDALPRPAWDLVDVDRYRRIWRTRHGYFSMALATSRGCPYHCNWCAKPIWGQRYNVRSPESVAQEVAWLRATYAPDHLTFVDDILGLRPGWIERYAELVEASDARTPFKSLCRADLLVRGDTVGALRRAGARSVWIGAESGSQKILDAMDKGTRVDQNVEAARRLRAAGISVGFFLQFGYPGETRRDIDATLRMVRAAEPDDIGISVSYPLPGTRFHDAVRTQLGLKRNWVDSADLAMMYRGPFSTAFYRQLHTVVHTEFRLRKALAALRRRPGPRLAARVAIGAVSLPLARLHLEILARLPHRGISALPQLMSADAAASPSVADPPSRVTSPRATR
ncbi:MAG: radical SAM protein [Chloroflexota bacterium]|nr:radical SAM protein [Chloroflexota bacterium]